MGYFLKKLPMSPSKNGRTFVSFCYFFLFLTGIIGLSGCGCGREDASFSGGNPSESMVQKGPNTGPVAPKTEKLAHSAFPWLESGQEVSGKKVSAENRLTIKRPGEEFNRKYTQGLELLEKEEYAKALEVFEEIIKTYPGSDEASMAEYRTAQIHFRNKSNNLALDVYKRIIQNYPNSPISENARAAITYLETFEQHEKAYVAPDADDRKRRGF